MGIKLHKISSIYALNSLENSTFTAIGNLRKITILDWLFRFRYSSIPVLTSLFPDVAKSRISDLLARMEKRGEIRQFVLVTGFTKVGYCLRDKGFLILQAHYENRTFSRFFTETGTLSASNFVHDLAIQHAIAGFIPDDPHEIGFANEWEIRRFFEGQKTKVVDAIVEKTIGEKVQRIAIEVELSPKTIKRLNHALYASNELIESGQVDLVLYLCPTSGLERSIKNRVKDIDLDPSLFLTRVSPQLKKLVIGGRA